MTTFILFTLWLITFLSLGNCWRKLEVLERRIADLESCRPPDSTKRTYQVDGLKYWSKAMQ